MRLIKLRNAYTEVKVISRVISRKPLYIFKIYKIINGKSYYPEKERKSSPRRFFDNLIWVIKNQELNNSYNYNGLDIKNWRNSNNFLPKRQFYRDMRLGNSYEKEGFSYNYLVLLRDKYIFSSYLANVIGEDKVIPTVALSHDESVYLPEAKTYISVEEFFSKERKMFCKINNGECANDVFLFEKKSGKYYLDNRESSLLELKKNIKGSKFIFQNVIQQHEVLSNLNGGSVNSIRIITVKGLSGEINIFSSFLRLGSTSSSFVDNTSAGGLTVSIDSNGILGKYGFYAASFGTKTEKHPVSNVVFEGYQLPYWNEVKELVEAAHKQFYNIQSIGWDVAITPNGPILIEGNDNWEIDTPQSIESGLKEKWHKLKNS